MKNQALTRFVKDECANYNRHYQTCLDDKPCEVLAGRRCGYFERVVLCPPDYKFRPPGYDYQKLFAQYAEQTKTDALVVKQRRCGCGNPLRLRQRYCADCAKTRAKTANQQRQKKYRLQNVST